MGSRKLVCTPPIVCDELLIVLLSLTRKLPFDPDYFDYIHIRSIAKGVPENLWDQLFAVRRPVTMIPILPI